MKENQINTSPENINERFSQIDKTLRLYEEIFPMDMTEIYIRHPRLDSIITKYRKGDGSFNNDDLKVIEKVIIDIKNSQNIASLKQDVVSATNDIYNLIFPETGVEKFVKFCTEQKVLDDYQHVLLAPAKGIERALGGIISSLNPHTYTELKAGARYMTGQSLEVISSIMSTMYDQFQELNSTKKVSLGVEFLASSMFLFGTVSKLGQILGKYKSLSKAIGVGLIGQNNTRDFVRIASLFRNLEKI